MPEGPKKENNYNKKKMIIIALSCMIFLCFTVVVLILFNKKDEEERVTTEVTTKAVLMTTTEEATEVTTEETTEATTEPELATGEAETTTEQKAAETPGRDYSGLFAENPEDKEKPVFLIKPGTISMGKGEAFDIHKYIGYADDADREPELVVDGEVDTSKTGSTTLNVSVKDDAGNVASEKVTVNVVESAGSTEPSKPTDGLTPFSEFDKTYRKDGVSLGIDVSRWEKEIDFNKVKAAGCDFVIMRLGGYDDGELYTDRCYIQNMKNAKAAGLKIGIYWHAEESTKDEVLASTKYLLDVLDGEKLDFPIAYDWEDFANFENYKMNIQDLNDCYHVFEGELSAAGYETSIYGRKIFMNSVWWDKGDQPVWLAHYTSNTDYTGKYYMWQQTSTGTIDGITTACDFNVLYNNE